MSLLSDTQYTPQRIYSLLRLLEAQDGPMGFDTIVTWFKPRARGFEQRGNEEDQSSIRQLIGATTSLGFIESPSQNRYRLSIVVPATLEGFADLAHEHLIGVGWDDADSVVLEAYAAVVVLTELDQQTSWLDAVAKDRAARINAAIRPGEPGKDGKVPDRFNATKYSPWLRWMTFLGLGFALPKGEFYPYPVQRLQRELARARTAKPFDVRDFMVLVAGWMPYLDGGRLFAASAEQARLAPRERSVSRVLSGAFRDLHDDKRITLETIGDAAQTYALASEPHAIRSVKTITVALEAADG